MKIFLINVGVNASHRDLRSPIFQDKKFELVPIPEDRISEENFIDSELVSRYRDLFKNKTFIPNRWLARIAHNDPEFKTCTYGDYPTKSPRVFLLRHAQESDLLFFLSRLTTWDQGGFAIDSAFYLVGVFQICAIIKDINSLPSKEIFDSIKENAHLRRAALDHKLYDGFWIFKGNEKSKKFDIAVPFNKDFADMVMRDASGGMWIWKESKTINQIIGSYTRSCRCIKDKTFINKFLEKVQEHNELIL
jgi:hypothetical protein